MSPARPPQVSPTPPPSPTAQTLHEVIEHLYFHAGDMEAAADHLGIPLRSVVLFAVQEAFRRAEARRG